MSGRVGLLRKPTQQAPSAARAQRDARSRTGPDLPAGNHALHGLLAGAPAGQPLDPDTRRGMEAHFGQDLSTVRVHHDEEAADSARAQTAKAYALGEHIVFAENRYAPATREGKRLLAHELAHVIQQRRGATGAPIAAGQTLESEAAQAGQAAIGSAAGAAIGGAAAPAVQREEDEDEERRQKKAAEKKKTQQRKEERGRAGKDEPQIAKERAQKELRKMEKQAQAPGTKHQSPKKKEATLKRYEDVLQDAPGTTLEKNKRKGAFDESLRTPGKTAGKPQDKYVAGGPQLPGQDLRPGEDKYAQPDYSIYRRNKDGKLERLHVNLKSDKLHLQSQAKAVATARYNTEQAIRNAASLPSGESIVISYARTPSKEVQQAMLAEHFKSGSPISEVRFGTTAHKRENYKPPASAAEPTPAKKKGAKKAKAKGAKSKAGAKGGAKSPAAAGKGAAAKPSAKPAPKGPAAPKAAPSPKAAPAPAATPAPKATPAAKAAPTAKAAPAVKTPAVKAPAVKAPTVKPPTVKAPTVKSPAVKAPTPKASPPHIKGGGGSIKGRGLGILIALGASLIASKAQASVDEKRAQGHLQGIEREVVSALEAKSEEWMNLQVMMPGATVHAVVTTDTNTFENFIVIPMGMAGAEVMDDTQYMGTSLESVTLSYQPVNKTWTTRDGSAARGGTDVHEYTTYSFALDAAPFDALVEYAKAKGLPLTALRAYASMRMAEAGLASDAGVGPRMSAYWARVIETIDEE